MSKKSSSGNEYSDLKNEGIWQHFLREKNGQSAQCKICEVIIKTFGGSTSGMHTHLQTKHKISIRKRPSSDETTASTSVIACGSSTSSSLNSKVNKVAPMDKYVKNADENSVGAILARMTSCDGLPFLVFTTSDHNMQKLQTTVPLYQSETKVNPSNFESPLIASPCLM